MSSKLPGGESEVDASHMLTPRIDNSAGKYVGEIKVKPQDQARLLLGSFAATSPLRGFSIQLTPNPDPDDAVVTQIANAGTAEQYKLLLQVINYGSKAVTAKVWQL